ncbi:MAG: 3-phosphoshikimate 1-carboxyvinyltransferase, partial [Lachnospiraceae bacterium]
MNIQHTTKGLRGEITVPGDKSISHRAVMLGSLANGTTVIDHFLNGADCLSTIDCFRKMGVSIRMEQHDKDHRVIVTGAGLHGLNVPDCILDAGNSGTTVRLLSGILAGQRFSSRLTGDASIQRRPMKRIMQPLRQMGANIVSVHDTGCAPLQICPSRLRGISY